MIPQYVAQEHRYGCTAAAVAMVVGKSYDEVQRCHVNDFSKQGVCIEDWFDYLFAYGFAYHRIYKVTQYNGWNKAREVWPHEPFAPIHICCVTTGQGSHAVVMLSNGDVLDPHWPGIHKLTDYVSTDQIIGLFKIGEGHKIGAAIERPATN